MSRRLKWLETYPPAKQKELRRLHYLSKLYDSKIILRFTTWNHNDEQHEAAVEFLNIPVLRNYLIDLPHQALMIGYNEKKYVKPVATTRVENMRICFNWKENNKRNEIAFKDVFEFARFLKANKDLAESVQFPEHKL